MSDGNKKAKEEIAKLVIDAIAKSLFDGKVPESMEDVWVYHWREIGPQAMNILTAMRAGAAPDGLERLVQLFYNAFYLSAAGYYVMALHMARMGHKDKIEALNRSIIEFGKRVETTGNPMTMKRAEEALYEATKRMNPEITKMAMEFGLKKGIVEADESGRAKITPEIAAKIAEDYVKVMTVDVDPPDKCPECGKVLDKRDYFRRACSNCGRDLIKLTDDFKAEGGEL